MFFSGMPFLIPVRWCPIKEAYLSPTLTLKVRIILFPFCRSARRWYWLSVRRWKSYMSFPSLLSTLVFEIHKNPSTRFFSRQDMVVWVAVAAIAVAAVESCRLRLFLLITDSSIRLRFLSPAPPFSRIQSLPASRNRLVRFFWEFLTYGLRFS